LVKTVTIKSGVATIPTLDGGVERLALGPEWWDLEGAGADVRALLEFSVHAITDDPGIDFDVVAPELESAVEAARPEHERLRELGLLRENLPIGQLASTIAAEPVPEHPYLVPGFIREQGVTLVTGREKRSGKSTLLAYLVGAMERGEPTIFGDAYPTAVRTVWATEEPTYSLREKIDMFGLESPFIVGFSEWMEASNSEIDYKSFEAKIAALEAMAKAYDAQHVVIDPLSRIAGIKDEAGAGELNEALNAVSVLAQKAGVAVTLIHHDNKADGRAVEDKARGSTATSAAVDQIVHIERRWPKEDPNARELVAWGRVKGSDWTSVVRLDPETNAYTVGDSPVDESKAAALRTDLDALTKLGEATTTTFGEATGTDRKVAERRLKALVAAGHATVEKDGRSNVFRPDVDTDSI
jgi:hypothetical protein